MELQPFRGISYNPALLDDPFAVLAPPYDVISQQEREIYYRRHQHNVVRLIFGREEPGDTPEENRYTRAADFLRTWLQRGVLTRHTQPAMYLVAEDYLVPDGTQRQRHGLIALCRLEPYERGIILPHEETSPIPKQMLFDLRSTVQANLSQIFALYDDDTGKIHEIIEAQHRQPPHTTFRDHDTMLRQVWAITQPHLLREIQGLMADRWGLIADGHHRYETCLEYQRAIRQSMPHGSGDEWFNFAMLYLTDIHDPGLTILPTHRLLRGLSRSLVEQLPQRLRNICQLEAFHIGTTNGREAQRRRFTQEMRRRGDSAHVIGLYTGDDTLWLLTWPPGPGEATSSGTGQRSGWSMLDVQLLHEVVLEKLLGIDVAEDTIAFTQDEATAVDLVASQTYQVAFLLNPTKVEQIVQHALAGKRMPRKSTYFYPKLLTGIVLHKEVGDADHFC